jgi:hypothetical protein
MKQSCDELPFYSQQCSDMDSVTQGHEVGERGYSPLHAHVNTTLKTTLLTLITVKTWKLIIRQ